MVKGTNIKATTKNVAGLTLSFGANSDPLTGNAPEIDIDGQTIALGAMSPSAARVVRLAKNNGKWTIASTIADGQLHKRHGLQGPIDDAFLDRFIMVAPTGTPLNATVGKWTEKEMAHAIDHWRRQFRGEAIVKKDNEITDADIASSNLVLWGDPSSNAILAHIANRLPIAWSSKELKIGDKSFNAGNNVAVMIFPNPLNPNKYVVLNSGFTFREYDYLNNARQVPKLPDWAVVNVSKPVTSRSSRWHRRRRVF